jgi:hypothetical protein
MAGTGKARFTNLLRGEYARLTDGSQAFLGQRSL